MLQIDLNRLTLPEPIPRARISATSNTNNTPKARANTDSHKQPRFPSSQILFLLDMFLFLVKTKTIKNVNFFIMLANYLNNICLPSMLNFWYKVDANNLRLLARNRISKRLFDIEKKAFE